MPVAISLAFGVLFATVITLLLVPALYMIVEDGFGFLARRNARASQAADPGSVAAR
ncbi:MAG: hypothetical protein VB948_00395 [Pseudomonadales bacterium]